jgi:hypothetical protein
LERSERPLKELLPDKLKTRLPGMGSSPETPLEETIVHIKFQDPADRWKWYVIEFDGEGTFFGLVVNAVGVVVGQFTLAELESLRFDAEGQGIRRDSNFQSMTVLDLSDIEPGIDEFLADRLPLTEIT